MASAVPLNSAVVVERAVKVEAATSEAAAAAAAAKAAFCVAVNDDDRSSKPVSITHAYEPEKTAGIAVPTSDGILKAFPKARSQPGT